MPGRLQVLSEASDEQTNTQSSTRKRRSVCRRRGGHTQRLNILSILTARLKVFLVFPLRLSLNYPFGISEAVGPGHPKKEGPNQVSPDAFASSKKTASRGHLQNSRSENLAAKLALRAKAKRKKESENQRERERESPSPCLFDVIRS